MSHQGAHVPERCSRRGAVSREALFENDAAVAYPRSDYKQAWQPFTVPSRPAHRENNQTLAAARKAQQVDFRAGTCCARRECGTCAVEVCRPRLAQRCRRQHPQQLVAGLRGKLDQLSSQLGTEESNLMAPVSTLRQRVPAPETVSTGTMKASRAFGGSNPMDMARNLAMSGLKTKVTPTIGEEASDSDEEDTPQTAHTPPEWKVEGEQTRGTERWSRERPPQPQPPPPPLKQN